MYENASVDESVCKRHVLDEIKNAEIINSAGIDKTLASTVYF